MIVEHPLGLPTVRVIEGAVVLGWRRRPGDIAIRPVDARRMASALVRAALDADAGVSEPVVERLPAEAVCAPETGRQPGALSPARAAILRDMASGAA